MPQPSQPLRQAYALAHAMQARPTPQLATRYFDTLRRMLDADPAADNDNAIGPVTAEGTMCRTGSTPKNS